jgi:hypothetical protein
LKNENLSLGTEKGFEETTSIERLAAAMGGRWVPMTCDNWTEPENVPLLFRKEV